MASNQEIAALQIRLTLEGRQCAGGQTYQTRSLKVRVVP